jgi:ElaB/YqjD/DUF883 family membrane-anchored ribosome-binding protein
MDKRSDDIRQDIEQTRAMLDEKIDMLESKASEVVDNVKQNLDTVKQNFDLKFQVQERPWVALGAAVATGFVLGSLGGKDESTQRYGQQSMTYDYSQPGYNQYSGGPSSMQKMKSASSDFLSQFDDEINLLKAAAMTTLTSFLRDTVRQAVPALGDQLDKMGGQSGGMGSGSMGNTMGGQSGSMGSSSGSMYGGSMSYSTSSGDERNFSTTSTGRSQERTTAPNASMDIDPNEGRVNHDAIPQFNRYGNPPPTPMREESDYYETYQPTSERERTVGSGDEDQKSDRY